MDFFFANLIAARLAGNSFLSAPCWLDLACPRPARTEAVTHCFVLCGGKKWKPQIRNITERDELLISLPVEQQLQELKTKWLE